MLSKCLIALLMVALLVTPSVEARTRSVDLAEDPKLVLLGGDSVASGGDIDGDGASDWLVGSPARNSSYVVFGGRAKDDVDLVNLGEAGFAIEGANPDDHASRVAGVGDVNGDGLDDVLVGAPGSSPLNRGAAGSAYVVFGKESTDKVDLSRFDLNIQGDAGFRIMGPSYRAFAGEDVAGAGDVNGDGLDDILVGAVFRGASYVVFGKSSSLPVDLLAFDMGRQDSQGYVIETPASEYNDLYSVAGGLDVNGDGVADPTVAVIRKEGGRGSIYVTFGQPSSVDPIRVRDLGGNGIRIMGIRRSGAGYSLSQVEDMTGDGRAELLVGAPGFSHDGSRGNAYVVFGRSKPGSIRLSRLGRRGFRIDGTHSRADFGTSVAAIPDLNGDRRTELVVGAPLASPHRRPGAGAAYVLFGKSDAKKVTINRLGSRGFAIAGASREDYVGWSVSSGGVDPTYGSIVLVGSLEGDDDPAGAAYVVHPAKR